VLGNLIFQENYVVLNAFRYFQVRSGTFRYVQVRSGTFRYVQVCSGTFRSNKFKLSVQVRVKSVQVRVQVRSGLLIELF
jgi:hypothetical protein